jgi:hypothetical protein
MVRADFRFWPVGDRQHATHSGSSRVSAIRHLNVHASVGAESLLSMDSASWLAGLPWPLVYGFAPDGHLDLRGRVTWHG